MSWNHRAHSSAGRRSTTPTWPSAPSWSTSRAGRCRSCTPAEWSQSIWPRGARPASSTSPTWAGSPCAAQAPCPAFRRSSATTRPPWRWAKRSTPSSPPPPAEPSTTPTSTASSPTSTCWWSTPPTAPRTWPISESTAWPSTTTPPGWPCCPSRAPSPARSSAASSRPATSPSPAATSSPWSRSARPASYWPAPATPERPLGSSCSSPASSRGPSGIVLSKKALFPVAWPRGTPSAWKPDCPSTATSWAPIRRGTRSRSSPLPWLSSR